MLRLFVLLLLSLPGMPSGLWHYEFITYLVQRLDKNANKLRACCFQDKNAYKLRSLQEPSGWRLAGFVRPRASLPRTTKNKPAHRCTPIINGEKFFLRTPKCYLWRSWDRDPEDSKNDPMVQAREHQADREPSLVIGRGHVSWLMLSLIALTRQKQLA